MGTRIVAGLLPLGLLAVGCGDDDDEGMSGAAGEPAASEAPTGGDDHVGAELDLEAIGLWDDGPCDASTPPLVIGQITTFETPVVSLRDQAVALEAAAEAFNARGGANGACIEVHTCDDGATIDQAVGCARELAAAGVVATVNDQSTAGQAEVSEAMSAAGIPRIATNVAAADWDDPNAYPLDPSGTGGTFMHPAALEAAGIAEVGIVRVDLPEASALSGLLASVYADAGLTFVSDTPVPAGTTDYSQFVLAAQGAGARGITMSLGEQEAEQVLRAAQQLGSELVISSGTGTFSHRVIAELGEFAEQVVLDNAFPPATFDLPAYDVLRADLAASGHDDLQPANMRTSPMRSWIGLYATLWMIRDSGLSEFSGEAVTDMLRSASDVPMLGIFGDEAWTPDTDHPGLFKRHGMEHYGVYRFDPDAPAPEGIEGNFVQIAEVSFADVVCGSPFGADEPC